jgi:response regulator of citrate/malate metabolism
MGLPEKSFPGGEVMLKILIVEDDRQLATTLKYLVEDNPRYRVVATADDLDTAVAAAETHRPELALVDLHLAHGTTGFSVAVRMQEYDIPCFFISGRAPNFPMPDLALGCLMKPFTAEDVHRSLSAAEDMMRGREAFRLKMPVNLMLYDQPTDAEPEDADDLPGFTPSRRSIKTRIGHWIAGTQQN